MGAKELRSRDNWQTDSGIKAISAEDDFFTAFIRTFSIT
jgi:hypothetical protein